MNNVLSHEIIGPKEALGPKETLGPQETLDPPKHWRTELQEISNKKLCVAIFVESELRCV